MKPTTRRARRNAKTAKKAAKKSTAAKRLPVTHKPIADDALPRGVFLSENQAAEEFGRDRRTIGKRIAELGIKPAVERNGYAVYRLKDLLEMERRGEDGEVDVDKMNPFERKAFIQSQREQLELGKERGELMLAEAHREEVARVLKSVSQELEVGADEIERDVGASPLVLEKIEEKFDKIRRRIYEKIVTPPPEPNKEDADG